MQNVLLRSAFLLCVVAHAVHAELITATATDFTNTTAEGLLDGVAWHATTSSEAPFLGINLSSGTWNVGVSLPPGVLALTASNVNAGDFQEFTFDTAISSGYFYIENFDSSSVANITSDATTFEMYATSSSITYVPATATSGVLNTSNEGYDGEGDAIFRFTGPLTSLRLDFTDGTGANGVFYGFSQASIVNSVPEPSSTAFLVIGVTGLALMRRRRSRRSSIGYLDSLPRQAAPANNQ
jgi:hypothetical protein